MVPLIYSDETDPQFMMNALKLLRRDHHRVHSTLIRLPRSIDEIESTVATFSRLRMFPVGTDNAVILMAVRVAVVHGITRHDRDGEKVIRLPEGMAYTAETMTGFLICVLALAERLILEMNDSPHDFLLGRLLADHPEHQEFGRFYSRHLSGWTPAATARFALLASSFDLKFDLCGARVGRSSKGGHGMFATRHLEAGQIVSAHPVDLIYVSFCAPEGLGRTVGAIPAFHVKQRIDAAANGDPERYVQLLREVGPRCHTSQVSISATYDSHLASRGIRIAADVNEVSDLACGHVAKDFASVDRTGLRACVEYHLKSVPRHSVSPLSLLGGALTVMVTFKPVSEGDELFYHFGYTNWATTSEVKVTDYVFTTTTNKEDTEAALKCAAAERIRAAREAERAADEMCARLIKEEQDQATGRPKPKSGKKKKKLGKVVASASLAQSLPPAASPVPASPVPTSSGPAPSTPISFTAPGAAPSADLPIKAQEGRAGEPSEAASAQLTSEVGEDENECIVCMEGVRTHAFVPCGHQCVCASCADGFARRPLVCPMCREKSMCVIPIFK